MTEPKSYRETVRALLEQLGLERRTADDMERTLCKAAILAMMNQGFTFTMASESIGVPKGTSHGWTKSDPDFASASEQKREKTRGWVLGELIANLRDGGKAAAQSANILANLYFPELRERKIEAHLSGAPDPERAAANLRALLGRGD